jgi:2-amino-4-hydroxy-6-hydroxymethyldihydropteridine diphosphokinase
MSAGLHTAILSLGGNLGNRAQLLTEALGAIDEIPGTAVIKRSALYETEPVGVESPDKRLVFLNAVVIIETKSAPLLLLDSLQQIERRLGRIRTGINHPRTVDIDIISFDEVISDDPKLTLPHPRASERRFVLQPLAEITPNYVLPGSTTPVCKILQNLPLIPKVQLSAVQWQIIATTEST